jgi:HEPN domain-containing protein
LLAGGHWDGAYYLAGYAVECALKACIAKATRRYDFPDKRRVDSSYSHNLAELVKIAELEDAREDREMSDPDFSRNWETSQRWSEQSRYRRYGSNDAELLLDAIRNRRHGVMAWIKLHW